MVLNAEHSGSCLSPFSSLVEKNKSSRLFRLKRLCVYKFVCIIVHCRAIHDVKATDLGLGKVRFKAEVDFDGRVVTRSYLEKQDFDQMLQVSLCIY